MTYWTSTVGATFYTITIEDRFVRMAMGTTSKETSGGNDVPAQRFLRSTRLKQHVQEVFGETVLAEVVSAAITAAELPISRRKV